MGVVELVRSKNVKIGKRNHEEEDDFVEEDVPSEENTFIPPRPPKRIYNADGTITDPELERIKKEEAERIAEEKRLAKEAKKAEKAKAKAQKQPKKEKVKK